MRHALINENSLIVEQVLVVSDQANLPAIPNSPDKPTDFDESKYKDEISRDPAYAAYVTSLNEWAMEIVQYDIDLAEAMKGRFIVPDGYILLPSDIACIGDTYENGEIIPASAPEPTTEQRVYAAQSELASLEIDIPTLIEDMWRVSNFNIELLPDNQKAKITRKAELRTILAELGQDNPFGISAT